MSICVRLQGGLGNQLFQYAMGRSLQERGRDVVFQKHSMVEGEVELHHRDKTQYGLDRLNTRVKFGVPSGGPVISDGDMKFRPDAYDAADGTHLSGHWQSEKYFSEIGDKLRQEIVPVGEPPEEVAKLAKQLESENSVFLHVRRGDYVTIPENEAYHGTMKWAYYEKALTIILWKHGSTLRPYLFTDDPEWCRIHMPWNVVETGSKFWDLYLMSKCRHAVVANSSFSWWGAWLGPDTRGTVVAPQRWFTTPKLDGSGIVPQRWTTI